MSIGSYDRKKQIYQNIDFSSVSVRKKYIIMVAVRFQSKTGLFRYGFQFPLPIRIKMQQPILRLVGKFYLSSKLVWVKPKKKLEF